MKDVLAVPEIELQYTLPKNFKRRPLITSASKSYDLILKHWRLERIDLVEEFKIILLNRENRVLGIANLSVGGICGTVIDPRLIFVTALKSGASSIVLVHNHPSGALKPSERDLIMTSRLKQCGEFLEIKVRDHLIISRDSYFSLNDNEFM